MISVVAYFLVALPVQVVVLPVYVYVPVSMVIQQDDHEPSKLIE